ncbi:PEP/pyruvate-binding domain-containing protein [Paludibaculum fermentans]|uniref:PEP/pyruvate-binding domain-containing protein n=1 Tax=Paludibaculum fermentans TaxID=1473598 RepID=UPI003EBD0543
MTSSNLARAATFSPDHEQEFVLNLADVEAGMFPLVGGKAANLGELIRAQLPVPAGVCVTTEAYRVVAASARIDFEALAAAPVEQVDVLARQAREALMAAPVPFSIIRAIEEAYVRLGDNAPVAVRSSATAEDLPNASFAGQQDTYLHVIGVSAVLDAVRRCWASLWTERAVVYRTKNGIDHRSVRLAVVIQRMVESVVSGVLFTANPVTGKRRQAVIDASPGLGEAVVSGAVNPDHFVVDTETRQILERRIGDKRFQVRSLRGGGTAHVEVADSSTEPCIPDTQVRALAMLGDRVEAHYRAPQDTEWAIDATGKLWLTQARPITTLFPLPAGARPEKLSVYFSFSVAQGVNQPMTPMGLAGFRLMASAAARQLGIRVDNPLNGPPTYAEAGQRIFMDLAPVLRGRVGRELMPRVLDVMESRSAALVRQQIQDPRLSITHRSPFLFLRRVIRMALRFGVPLQLMRALAQPGLVHARIRQQEVDLTGRLTLPDSAGALQRLNFVEQVLLEGVVPLVPLALPSAILGMGLHGLAGHLLGGEAQASELQAVLRGLPNNVTTEMDLALWALAASLRRDEACCRVMRDTPPAELARQYQLRTLPPHAQQQLGEFLTRYGHRAVAEIDLGVPRWADDPTHILGVLSNYLRLDQTEASPDAVFARGAAEAEAMIEKLAARARRRGLLRGALVRFALGRARQLCGLREIPKYYAILVLAAARRELLRVGRELSRQSRIQTPSDVFFLNLSEAREALMGRDVLALIEERQRTHEVELRRKRIPRILLSDGTEPEMRITETASANSLAGTPASAGSVTGIARVVLDPVGARIEPGGILVAPSTDPGWTPLFLTAGGLVMEMGGANSHGAVVAREYGIPAVVGVPEATVRIRNGQKVTVDGAAGTVSIVAE